MNIDDMSVGQVSHVLTSGNGNDDEDGAVNDDANQRVRIPLFPAYSELRHLLRVWPTYPRKQVTGLRAAANDARLLIEHNIGVRKRPIELLESDVEAFAAVERDC